MTGASSVRDWVRALRAHTRRKELNAQNADELRALLIAESAAITREAKRAEIARMLGIDPSEVCLHGPKDTQ